MLTPGRFLTLLFYSLSSKCSLPCISLLRVSEGMLLPSCNGGCNPKRAFSLVPLFLLVIHNAAEDPSSPAAAGATVNKRLR